MPASITPVLPIVALVVIAAIFVLFLVRALKGEGMGQDLKDWRESIKDWNEKKLEKIFKQVLDAGHYRLAGEMAFTLERWDEAAQFYLKGSHYLGAAQSLLKMGKMRDAAKIYQDLEDYSKAADLFERGGDPASAGQIYYLMGDLQKSAEHFEEAKDKKRAAEVYLRAGLLRKANKLYEEMGDYKNAADALVKALEQAEARIGKEVVVSELSFFQELTMRAAEDYKKAGEIFEQHRSFGPGAALRPGRAIPGGIRQAERGGGAVQGRGHDVESRGMPGQVGRRRGGLQDPRGLFPGGGQEAGSDLRAGKGRGMGQGLQAV